jgi:hypothetical protein
MNGQTMIVRILILGLAVLLLATAGFGGNRSGTVSEQFLKLGTSARAIGIGGAQVALAEGVSSIAYNPAGILSVENYGAGFTYTALYANIQHSFFGIVKNVPGLGAIGVDVVMLSTDDMMETTPANPEGTGQYFRASDFAFGIGYARQVTDQFQVGIHGKVIKSYLYNADIGASSFAFDIGTMYWIPQLKSHIGVSLTNIGKDVQFIQEPYSIPTALRFGVLVDVIKEEANQLVTTLQITRLNDAEEQYNVGAEYVFNNVVALRGGWKFFYDQENVTAGFGVKLNTFGINGNLDYGYNNFKYLPGTHSFTFEVYF